MADQAFDPDMFTSPFQLTKGMHRDVYPAVDPKSPSQSAKGKVVVVTGAGGGIGYAVAKAWVEAGATGVVLAGRTPSKLEPIAAELGPTAIAVKADIAVEAEAKNLIDQAVAKFGHVDTLINTAYTNSSDGKAGEVKPATWWGDWETNVHGVYNTVHYFIAATAGKGTVINVVTLGASFLGPGLSSYSGSKLAVIKLGEYLDLEHPELRVFSVHPGIVEASKGRGTVIDQFTPFAKDKQELTAGVSLWLQKPEADFLSGGYLSVNWDVEELVAHKEEIVEKKLTQLAFLKGEFKPGGYQWKQ